MFQNVSSPTSNSIWKRTFGVLTVWNKNNQRNNLLELNHSDQWPDLRGEITFRNKDCLEVWLFRINNIWRKTCQNTGMSPLNCIVVSAIIIFLFEYLLDSIVFTLTHHDAALKHIAKHIPFLGSTEKGHHNQSRVVSCTLVKNLENSGDPQ